MICRKGMLLHLLAFTVAQSVLAKAAILPIIPYPQVVEARGGSFALRPGQMTMWLAADTRGLTLAADELARAIEQNVGAPPSLEGRGKQVIWLGLPSQDGAFDKLCRQAGIWPEDKIGDEGYVLLIQRNRIIVAANQPAGVYYGVQSLKQLLRGSDAKDRLPGLKIVDWPDFRYRGVQDDISRGPVPTMDFMKSQVRRMAELKLNLLSYYTEHVFSTPSHPGIGPAGGALSLEEWGELAAYAARYHIQLLGNLQTFGHFEKILAYPRYSHLGEGGRMLSPIQEESYQFLQEIFAELVPVFPAPFFNVNADETWDLGRGASKARVDSLGIAVVYADHLNRIHAELSKYGKRTMMWADMALAHPEILDRLPKDIILVSWEYSPLESFEQLLAPLSQRGFDFMVSPGVLNSNRLMPDYRMTFENIRGFITEAANYDVMGVLNTIWDDGGMALFSRDWYGVAYGADQSWQARAKTDFEFTGRFDRAVYGNLEGGISEGLDRLTELTDLAPTQEMNEQVFWDRIVPPRGGKLRLMLTDWDRVLEICAATDKALDRARPTAYAADLDYLRFTVEQYRYMARSRQALFDAAQAYRSASLHQIDDRAGARASLVQALQLVSETRTSLALLSQQFRWLWLRENRVYWLDHIIDAYDERLEALADAERRVLSALEDFDKGHALPPPNEVRLDIEASSGRYFQSWLMAGPFPYSGATDAQIDYLASMGGEQQARPTVYSEVDLPGGGTVGWRRVNSPDYAKVDLAALFDQNQNVVAYAYCRIDSDQARVVRATLGSNDGIEVFLNGEIIHRRHVKRSLQLDEDEIELPLQAGRNHLMLKIDQGKGGWGFSFQLPDNEVRNHKNTYRLLP